MHFQTTAVDGCWVGGKWILEPFRTWWWRKKFSHPCCGLNFWLFDFYINGQRICSFLSCFHEDVLYFYDAFICDKQSWIEVIFVYDKCDAQLNDLTYVEYIIVMTYIIHTQAKAYLLFCITYVSSHIFLFCHKHSELIL